MSRRTAAWLAWSVWAVCVVLITLTLVLDFTTEEFPLEVGGFRYDPGFAVLTGVLSLAYPAVGALIASRLPTNPIGWIFCGLGLIYVTRRFTTAYADHAFLETLALPWGEFAAWFSTWIWSANPTLGVFLMLLFPSGRLPSRRWRIVVWLTVLGAAMSALGFAFIPGYSAPPHIPGEPVRNRGSNLRQVDHVPFLRSIASSGHDAAFYEPSRRALFGHTQAAPCEGRRSPADQVVPVRRRAVNLPG